MAGARRAAAPRRGGRNGNRSRRGASDAGAWYATRRHTAGRRRGCGTAQRSVRGRGRRVGRCRSLPASGGPWWQASRGRSPSATCARLIAPLLGIHQLRMHCSSGGARVRCAGPAQKEAEKEAALERRLLKRRAATRPVRPHPYACCFPHSSPVLPGEGEGAAAACREGCACTAESK